MSRDLEDILEQLKNQEETDETRLSAEEQQRIFQMTMQKIKGQENVDSHKQRRFWRKQAVAVAAIILVLSVGSIGVAAVVHWNLNDKFARFFGTQESEQEEHSVPVQSLKIASQEIDHVKITADQVIADDHSMYVLFHLSGVAPGSTDLIFKDIDVVVDSDNYVVSDPVCSGYEDDNPYYILEVRTTNNLAGKPISLKFGEIGYNDETEQFITLTKGGYHLSWNLNYQIKTNTIAVNRKIQLYGGTALLDHFVVSPLSVTAYLKNIKTEARESDNPNDRLRVVMKDGVIYDSYRMDSGSVLNDYDQISLGLHHIIRESDIQEIQFAGITIPIHPNTSAEKEYRYENKKMGITIDLPETLHQAVEPGDTKSYRDEYSKCDVDEVHFIAQIGQTKLDLFTVIRYHKMMSVSEFEEINPLASYITNDASYTYALQVTEELPEHHQKEFAELVNHYVVNLLPRINTKSNQ